MVDTWQRSVFLVAVLFLSLMVCSCAATWVHATKNQTEFYADSSSCEAQAGQAQGYWGGLMRYNRVYDQCMMGKGWTPQTPQ